MCIFKTYTFIKSFSICSRFIGCQLYYSCLIFLCFGYSKVEHLSSNAVISCSFFYTHAFDCSPLAQ